MPAEQRAELKRLAEAATSGPWQATTSFPPYVSRHVIGCRHQAIMDVVYASADAAYIAAVSPDVALATLAYVEALEAALAAALSRAEAAETEVAGLRRAPYHVISLGMLPAEDEPVLLYKGPLTNMWPVRGQLKSEASNPYWVVDKLPYMLENYHGWAYPHIAPKAPAAPPVADGAGEEGGQGNG